MALVARRIRATVIKAKVDDNRLMSSLMTDSEDLVEASAEDSAAALEPSVALVEA